VHDQTVMDPQSLKVLEWPAVQEMLAVETESPFGLELARRTGPLGALAEARQVRDEVGEFRALLAQQTGLPFHRLLDIRPALQRSRPAGAALAARELLAIACSLEAVGGIRLALARHRDRCPRLDAIASGLDEQHDLVTAIRGAIEESGEVADAASARLAALRRQLHDLRTLIQARLQAILGDPQVQPFIVEPIVTLRSDRYVIPVKAGYRVALKGIVHDRSASGVAVFLEPQEVVELNNQLRLVERAEAEEVRKVLQRLTGWVRQRADAILAALERAATLEVRYAAAKLAERLDAAPPSLKEAGPLILLRARHPVLLKQRAGEGRPAVVPIDLRVGAGFDALLITGPNTGGKTVALKTAGLLSLMALAGLHLPASPDSEVPFFRAVLADIGDEQSIEQSLSTFSSHMTQVRRVLEVADSGTLVLLDELGAGTDPVEGASLGIAILEGLLERRALVVATSHLDAIKAYAYCHPRIENACVEFDLDTLSPLYRLSVGFSGRSQAIAIASRLGFPSPIIERAQALLGSGDDRLGLLVERVEGERRRLVAERDALALEIREAQRARREAEARAAAALASVEQFSQQARRQVQQVVAEARAEVARLLRQIRSASAPLKAVQDARSRLADVERQADTALASIAGVVSPAPTASSPSIRPGQQVRIRGHDQLGIVSSEPGADGRVEVQFPLGRVTLPLAVVIPEAGGPPRKAEAAVHVARASEEPPAELNLLGCSAEEAARRVDRYIGDAFLAGLPTVRIVHGKGGGVLRRVVAEVLQGHPLVVSFRPADYRDGGIGATVAELQPRAVSSSGAASGGR